MNAPPDGYTLLLASTSGAVNEIITKMRTA